MREPQYRPQLHRPRACPLHVPFLPHCKSESLSVFRKSCLARSRISGSSLEVRGKGSGKPRAVAAAARSQPVPAAVHTLPQVVLAGRAVDPGLLAAHFRDEKAVPEVSLSRRL